MQNVLAFAMPGPFELIVLLAIVLIPIGVLFAVIYFAVKLATKGKRAENEPRQR